MEERVQSRIIVERDAGIASLTFNRPERLNAMTIETWQLMGRHLAELSKDRAVRCLVLAGAGRAFLAGHDVEEIRTHNEEMSAGRLSPAQLREWQKALQDTTRYMRLAPFPIVAAVQGYAVGAGCEVVFACDLVVAADDAKFGFPEVNIGVTITNGGTFFAPRKIGLAKAREMAYTGEFIDAQEAYRIGLVNWIVPLGQERAEAEKLARRIASRAPVAVQLHKMMIDRGLDSSLETMLSIETECLVQTAMTKDNLEGTNAYFEKREPRFTGD